MEHKTASQYKKLQGSLKGGSSYLDALISVTLAKSRVRPLVLADKGPEALPP